MLPLDSIYGQKTTSSVALPLTYKLGCRDNDSGVQRSKPENEVVDVLRPMKRQTGSRQDIVRFFGIEELKS